jgi:hypothetical protein
MYPTGKDAASLSLRDLLRKYGEACSTDMEMDNRREVAAYEKELCKRLKLAYPL